MGFTKLIVMNLSFSDNCCTLEAWTRFGTAESYPMIKPTVWRLLYPTSYFLTTKAML